MLKLVTLLLGTVALASWVRGGSNASYSAQVLFPLAVPPGTQGVGYNTLGSMSGNQAVGDSIVSGAVHAELFTVSGGVDINPSGFAGSYAWATSGAQQVGFGDTAGGNRNAFLWSGSAASAVNLNPVGFTSSSAQGVGGGQQVGYGTGASFGNHALLWSGRANGAIDLNPAGFYTSIAYAANGSQQAGSGSNGTNTVGLVWSGTAASAKVLSSPYALTEAFGVGGGQEVGYGAYSSSSPHHALLWPAGSTSAVDLNPTNLNGFSYSEANGTNGMFQVGDASGTATNNEQFAMLWSGTAATAVNLEAALPLSGNWNSSTAYSVDDQGNVFGLAFGSYNGSYNAFAVRWAPTQVPEPTALTVLATGSMALLRRRRLSFLPH